MIPRKLAPFGKQIAASRRSGDLHRYYGTSANGKTPALFLCAGDLAWHAARDWSKYRLVTLLPPGDDPYSYKWSFLAGADPVLLWRCGDIDGEALKALIVAVMEDGVDSVYDLSTGTRYRAKIKEAQHAA